MKKKIIFISIWLIIIFILINVLYGFFYEDDISSIFDKIAFKKNYYSREILECNVDNNNEEENIISKNNMSVELVSINYEQESGMLNAEFDFYTDDEIRLEKMRAMLRVHDDKNIFYNKSVGNMLYLGGTDYILYNRKLYSKLSNKNFDISKMDEEKEFNFSVRPGKNGKKLKLEFNLGENYKISDSLYIEFLDLIYKPNFDTSQKPIYPLGEFKFIINF